MQDCYFLHESVETQSLNQYRTKEEIILLLHGHKRKMGSTTLKPRSWMYRK